MASGAAPGTLRGKRVSRRCPPMVPGGGAYVRVRQADLARVAEGILMQKA